jgi:hypothetical protein
MCEKSMSVKAVSSISHVYHLHLSVRYVPVSLFEINPHGTAARCTVPHAEMDLRHVSRTAKINFIGFLGSVFGVNALLRQTT